MRLVVSTPVRAFVAAAVLLVVSVCPATAQQSNRGLFRGLFGGAEPVAGRSQVLDLTASAFAAYLKDVALEGDEVVDLWVPGASAALTYQWIWKQASVGAYANGGTSYVERRNDFDASPWINSFNVGGRGGFSRQIARRISFAADAGVDYSPNYGFGFNGVDSSGFGPGIFGGGFGLGPDRLTTVPGLDYTVASQGIVAWRGNVNLSRAVTARSLVSVYYSAQQARFLGASDGFNDQLTQVAGVGYSNRLNRFVGVRAAYGYRRTSSEDGEPSISHDVTASVDGGYGKEFEIARRTTFSFDTRSNIFVADRISDDGTVDPSTRFFVGGFAALAHRWGRSWQAGAQYSRSASFVENFTDPVFSNTVSASVRGIPVRRLDFIARVARSLGEVGFTSADRGFSTTTGTAQLRLAISKNLAAFAQYFYYTYDFERGVTLPGSVPQKLDRQGGSVGLTAWLPLL